MSFGSFGNGGNAFGGFQQQPQRQSAAFKPASLGFQSAPTYTQQAAPTSSASFDTGRNQSATVVNPFAGIQGNLNAPAPNVMMGQGRNLCITA